MRALSFDEENEQKWHRRFLNQAKIIAKWSKDPSTKVGAIIVNDNNVIIGTGYNGFPRGVQDLVERYNDRTLKYTFTVHAELNAILNANQSVKGCHLYCYAPKWKLPCVECTKAIIQSGIKTIIMFDTFELSDIAEKNYDISKTMLDEAKIAITIVEPASEQKQECSCTDCNCKEPKEPGQYGINASPYFNAPFENFNLEGKLSGYNLKTCPCGNPQCNATSYDKHVPCDWCSSWNFECTSQCRYRVNVTNFHTCNCGYTNAACENVCGGLGPSYFNK